jgi:hypothetical protein
MRDKRAHGGENLTSRFTKQGKSRLRHVTGLRLLLPDKGSHESIGAHAHRPGNPDRPARRQTHRTGAVAASPMQSRAVRRPRTNAIVFRRGFRAHCTAESGTLVRALRRI